MRSSMDNNIFMCKFFAGRLVRDCAQLASATPVAPSLLVGVSVTSSTDLSIASLEKEITPSTMSKR